MGYYNQNIVKACLLGTNNKKLNVKMFSAVVQKHLDMQKVPELVFLDGLSLTGAYRQGGQQLVKLEGAKESISICPNENRPYCHASVVATMDAIFAENGYSIPALIPVIVDKINEGNTILPPRFITKIQPLLLEDKSIAAKKDEIVQAFGERGKWIFAQASILAEQPEKIEILDLSPQERLSRFKALVRQDDQSETLVFLDEVFKAETVARQKNYLKTLSVVVSSRHDSVVSFLGDNLRKNNQLSNFLELVKINNKNSPTFNEYFNKLFKSIWKPKKGVFASLVGLKLQSEEKLIEILEPLDKFNLAYFSKNIKKLNGLDQKLYFIFSIVPAELWKKELKISSKELVKAVSSISNFDKIPFDGFSFAQALTENITRFKDFELALEIHAHLEYNVLDPSFLAVMPKERALNFILKNATYFKEIDLDLILFLINTLELKTPWSAELTNICIENALYVRQYNRQYLRKSLWAGVPYYHSSGVVAFHEALKNSHHANSLQDDFDVIWNVKLKFEQNKY